MFIYFREPYDKNPVLISTLSVIKCRHAAMDLVRVETRSQVCMLVICLLGVKEWCMLRFQVLMAVLINITAFFNVMPCNLVERDQSF